MTAGATSDCWASIEAALLARRPIWVSYHGRDRLVCPHALGWKSARPMLLGYQVDGQTSTGALDPDPSKRWRCMYIDEIDHLHTDETAPWASAENYNPSRPFSTIDQVALAVA